MSKGSNPSNILVRMLDDAKRLEQWTLAHGDGRQRKLGGDLVKLHEHMCKIFLPVDLTLPENKPVPRKRLSSKEKQRQDNIAQDAALRYSDFYAEQVRRLTQPGNNEE